MNRSTTRRRLSRALLCFAGVAIAAGCSKDDVTTPDNNPKSFTLALASTALTVSAGGHTTTGVTITPMNGAGPVTLSVEGAPTGLTAAFDPSPATTASALTVTTVAALAPGSYNLTVRGVSIGSTDQTVPFTVNVVSAGTGSVSVSFANCPASERPAWFAFQDGSGAWTQVTGVGDVYQFTFAGPNGGLAYATTTGSPIVTVEYFNGSDLPTNTLDYLVRLDRCPDLVGETVNGTVAGLAAGELANVSIGSAQAQVNGNVAFQVLNARDGSMDLVGFKSLATDPGTGSRMFLQRGLNPANGGSVGAMDFSGANSFAPTSATMTISNLLGGETYKHAMYYYTAGGTDNCELSNLYTEMPGSAGTFTAFGVPAINQLGTDWHAVGLFTTVGPNSFRTLVQYFQAMGPQTLTLGAALPTPTVSVLAGPYKRLQGVVTLPSDYTSRASLRYQDQGASQALAIISATMAWLGGASVTLSLPDFTGVTGWNNAWAPPTGSTVFWSMQGSTATNPSQCAANAKYISAIQSGTN